MMPKMRRSEARDAQRTVEIWRLAVNATHDFLKPEDRLAIDQEVQDFLPSAPLWLAVDDNDWAIGFMLVEGESIEALFIDPAFHGRGVGKAMVAHALQGRSSITTNVNEQNLRAVGFYEHLGFVATGRSADDGQGRPYPLIHMRLSQTQTNAA
jgi:putative acetyltransferase